MVSLFPELIEAASSYGVVGRAISRELLDIELINPRSFARDKHNTVDDRPYGGGPGMVMMVEPLRQAVAQAQQDYAQKQPDTAALPVIYLSPCGERLDQAMVSDLAGLQGMILIAGRYEGIDERFIEAEVDREISVGDYVLSGGELPALVLLDAVARLQPGVLGNSASAVSESHLDGLLDYPHYTRPENSALGDVPPVLLQGDHGAVDRWRRKQALIRTWLRRPDMLSERVLSDEERSLLAEGLAELEDQQASSA
jgi:tRNA (guanine37-N1)-methyltransferase